MKLGVIWLKRIGWKHSAVIQESVNPGLQALREFSRWRGRSRSNKTSRLRTTNTKIDLAQANKDYEARFNRTFIVCATGKSAQEILEILRRRLRNDDETELHEAAEQQRLDHSHTTEEMALAMNRISTHVLDTARGKPAQDVPVRLEQKDGSGNWLAVAAARTDQDGRCGQLLSNDKPFGPGFTV